MKLALCSSPAHIGASSGDDLDENLIRKVERGDIVDQVSESGKIAPSSTSTSETKVSGEVEAVHVEEGQTVAKGDPLRDRRHDYAREVSPARRRGAPGAAPRPSSAAADLGRMAQAHDNHAVSEAEFDRAEREVRAREGRARETAACSGAAVWTASTTRTSRHRSTASSSCGTSSPARS